MQDYFRLQQLEGRIDSNISLTVKPVAFPELNDRSNNLQFDYSSKDLTKGSDFFQFKLLPLSAALQYNSKVAYGWNDGLMIPAKGFQEYMSGGFYIKAGPLRIQALPEFVYAANPQYLSGNDLIAAGRYSAYISPSFGPGADLPLYYEKAGFSTVEMGQSSVRLTFEPLSFGISNENLWWGPGRRNSLIMSNSSRGFKHITLNTTKPINISIGSLEGQIISGRLENTQDSGYDFTKDEWRYLSGMVLTYQPKWVPGLFLGFTRVFQVYNSDINGISDYFPLLQSFEKKNTDEDSKTRDQLTSIFAKFVFKEANAEVYAEFARNDHSYNLRDFAQEPQHARAYLFGAQKLTTASAANDQFLISAEISQLSQSLTRILRPAGTFYTHNINQGYTNYGEVLGAGTGPGGNLQTFEFSWINGFKKVGVQIERYEHNKDYYQTLIDPAGASNEQWIDISGGFLVNWDFKNILVRSQLTGIQSFNYLWQTGLNDLPQKHVFNLHANFGLHYYFK